MGRRALLQPEWVEQTATVTQSGSEPPSGELSPARHLDWRGLDVGCGPIRPTGGVWGGGLLGYAVQAMQKNKLLIGGILRQSGFTLLTPNGVPFYFTQTSVTYPCPRNDPSSPLGKAQAPKGSARRDSEAAALTGAGPRTIRAGPKAVARADARRPTWTSASPAPSRIRKSGGSDFCYRIAAGIHVPHRV